MYTNFQQILARTLPHLGLAEGYFVRAEVVTISDLVLSTMSINSFCSAVGTRNFARLARKSTNNACHSFSVIWKSLWAVFISRPVYLQGPPVAEQTRFETCVLRPAFRTSFLALLMFGFAFSVALTKTRSMKSSTTAAME